MGFNKTKDINEFFLMSEGKKTNLELKISGKNMRPLNF